MTEAIDILTSASLWAAVLRIATPLIFGVLGALICERAGVLNLGIEGIMTAGAMAGWLAVFWGADLWTGLLVAMLTGMILGLLHAFLTVVFGPITACLRPWDHAFRGISCGLPLPALDRGRRPSPHDHCLRAGEYPRPVRPAFLGRGALFPDGPHLSGASGGGCRRLGPDADASGPCPADDW